MSLPLSSHGARRRLLLGAVGALALTPLALRAQAAPRHVDVWKTPSCGCCGDWVTHLEQAGYHVKVHEVNDTARVRARVGIAPRYGSCHTALIDGYGLEGHVPAEDIATLLAQRPAGSGLAVPGMPVGSPGMDGEVYGDRRDDYDVLLVQRDGSARVWRAVRAAS